MKEIYKVSVIIPIYNVQEYLHECVKSVVSQTYKNLEIILVDDGSPDSCPTMCDDWEKKDDRIITIHKKNGGLSDARNAGLIKASGEYVLYVDSDDYLEADAIEWMVSCAINHNAEIVACTCKKTNNENISTLLTQNLVEGTGIEMLEFAFENEIWYAWGKLIKAAIAKKCPFAEGLIYEDVENTPRSFLMADKVVFSLDGRYNYRIRTDSIMGENKVIPKSDIAKVIDMDCRFIADANISALDKNKMYKYLFKQLAYNYNLAVKAYSSMAEDVCKQIEAVFYKNKALWKKCGCISNKRKIGYWMLSEHPAIYKLGYRLYSARGKKKRWAKIMD